MGGGDYLESFCIEGGRHRYVDELEVEALYHLLKERQAEKRRRPWS